MSCSEHIQTSLWENKTGSIESVKANVLKMIDNRLLETMGGRLKTKIGHEGIFVREERFLPHQ